jgi:hypothetical protein
MTRYLLLSASCGFVDVGRLLWREDGPVIYNCRWSSPTQSFSAPSPAGHSQIRDPPTWRATSPYLYPQKRGGTGFPFSHFLPFAELRWRYSYPPPRGHCRTVRARVTLRRAIYRQSVRLSAEPLETHDQYFFNWTLAVIVLLLILSDERMGLSFTTVTGPRQRSHS